MPTHHSISLKTAREMCTFSARLYVCACVFVNPAH